MFLVYSMRVETQKFLSHLMYPIQYFIRSLGTIDLRPSIFIFFPFEWPAKKKKNSKRNVEIRQNPVILFFHRQYFHYEESKSVVYLIFRSFFLPSTFWRFRI